MCVYGGSAVPPGGVGDRHLATVPKGVAGDRLPWGGAGGMHSTRTWGLSGGNSWCSSTASSSANSIHFMLCGRRQNGRSLKVSFRQDTSCVVHSADRSPGVVSAEEALHATGARMGRRIPIGQATRQEDLAQILSCIS